MSATLSDTQKEYLAENYRLVFKGIKSLSQRRGLAITEDEVQDCVAKVLKQFVKYDPALAKESTFIYRNCDFALRAVVEARRRSSRRPHQLQSADSTEYELGYCVDHPEGIAPDLKVDLSDAILRLPSLWAEVITRRIINQEPYPSISKHYGRSISWSQVIVRNALLQLKMELYHWRNHDSTYPD